MNSKNIGPIIQGLFQRSVEAVVIASVVVVLIATKHVFDSDVKAKLLTIEQLKREKDTLGLERDGLEKDKTTARSQFEKSTEDLAIAQHQLNSKISEALNAFTDARNNFDSKIAGIRARFSGEKDNILTTLNDLKKEFERARDAAKKAEKVYEQGSYYWAWLCNWGKSWEDYLNQRKQEKGTQEASLQSALDEYAKYEKKAPELLRTLEGRLDLDLQKESADFKANEKNPTAIEDTERENILQIEKRGNDSKKDLARIDEKKQKVESRLVEIELTLAAIPWWQQFESEVWSVFRKYAWAIISGAIMFITPVGSWIRRLLVWFGPGAWIERRKKPLDFPEWHKGPSPILTTLNQVSLEVPVKAGEIAWFRDDYLDRTTRPKGTKFGLLPIFSREFWLMSLIDGLWWMTVVPGDSENKTSFKVSDTDNPVSEFAVVEIPANSSLIIRPHFIIGLTFPEGSPPILKRHWRLTQLEAWCVGQLWFFELSGPIRVVLRGARGVQSHLSVNDDR